MDKVRLGSGILDWHPLERQTDRYGTVFMVGRHQTEEAVHDFEGTRGTLLAEVTESRRPVHPGDPFHGVYPEKPARGDVIEQGRGVLSHLPPVDTRFSRRIGLLPTDGRATMWLDIKALYRVHVQRVTLWFLPCLGEKRELLLMNAKRSGLEPQPGLGLTIMIYRDKRHMGQGRDKNCRRGRR